MKTAVWKWMGLFAVGVLLSAEAGCQSYGGKPVEVALSTNPPLIIQPGTGAYSNAKAYVASIEGWNQIIGNRSIMGASYSWPSNAPAQEISPPDPKGLELALQPYLVKEGPPGGTSADSAYVNTWVMPYHSIYVVELGTNFYWNDITPSLNGNNNFTVSVPDANSK